MTRGPYGWRNAAGARAGVSALERYEAAFYGDARVTGELIGSLGPYDLLNALDFEGQRPKQILVLRATVFSTPVEVTSSPRELDDLKTDFDSYHGGDLADEIAALVALALGVRCRSGGTTRHWFNGSELDGPGHPAGFGHRRPYLPDPVRGPQLPYAGRAVDITTGTELLKRYLLLTPEAAMALVRAARLYGQAIWIADDDPGQAWLWLISALEVAAEQWRGSDGDTAELLRQNWGELSELVEPHGEALHSEVARVVKPLMKSQHRFVSFVMSFGPEPPANRSHDWSCVDWACMRDHLKTIYSYRSKALHAGVPIPAPMCEPPRSFDGESPIERPLGLSTMTLDGEWIAEDVPMLLWVFEHIARESLLAWWAQLPTNGTELCGR